MGQKAASSWAPLTFKRRRRYAQLMGANVSSSPEVFEHGATSTRERGASVWISADTELRESVHKACKVLWGAWITYRSTATVQPAPQSADRIGQEFGICGRSLNARSRKRTGVCKIKWLAARGGRTSHSVVSVKVHKTYLSGGTQDE